MHKAEEVGVMLVSRGIYRPVETGQGGISFKRTLAEASGRRSPESVLTARAYG